jgi:hypothetical protein
MMIMQGTVTAAIAVVGTLLGSVITYLFQRKTTQQLEMSAFQRQLRSERAIAYSDFAEAVRMDLRGWDNWWFRKHRSRRRRPAYDALMKAYDLDSATYHALARVQRVANNSELLKSARHVYEMTHKLRDASTATELGARADAADEALEDFLQLASREVQQLPSSGGLTG